MVDFIVISVDIDTKTLVYVTVELSKKFERSQSEPIEWLQIQSIDSLKRGQCPIYQTDKVSFIFTDD